VTRNTKQFLTRHPQAYDAWFLTERPNALQLDGDDDGAVASGLVGELKVRHVKHWSAPRPRRHATQMWERTLVDRPGVLLVEEIEELVDRIDHCHSLILVDKQRHLLVTRAGLYQEDGLLWDPDRLHSQMLGWIQVDDRA
jgi:hypothetical protein